MDNANEVSCTDLSYLNLRDRSRNTFCCRNFEYTYSAEATEVKKIVIKAGPTQTEKLKVLLSKKSYRLE